MCGHGEFLAVPSRWDITLRMRVQGIGRKQWHGCCTGTMCKVSRGWEQDVVQGRVRKDGSWVGLGDVG